MSAEQANSGPGNVQVDVKVEDNDAPVNVEVNIDPTPEQRQVAGNSHAEQEALAASVPGAETPPASAPETTPAVPAEPEATEETTTERAELERTQANMNRHQNEDNDAEWSKETQNQLAADIRTSLGELSEEVRGNTVVPVRRGDTLRSIVIALTGNGTRSQRVDYRSDHLPADQKPTTLGAANKIEIGQRVWVENGVIIVDDAQATEAATPAAATTAPAPAATPTAAPATGTAEILTPEDRRAYQANDIVFETPENLIMSATFEDYQGFPAIDQARVLHRFRTLENRPYNEVKRFMDFSTRAISEGSNNAFLANAVLELATERYPDKLGRYTERLIDSQYPVIRQVAYAYIMEKLEVYERLGRAGNIDWQNRETFVNDRDIKVRLQGGQAATLFRKQEVRRYGIDNRDEFAAFLNNRKHRLQNRGAWRQERGVQS